MADQNKKQSVTVEDQPKVDVEALLKELEYYRVAYEELNRKHNKFIGLYNDLLFKYLEN